VTDVPRGLSLTRCGKLHVNDNEREPANIKMERGEKRECGMCDNEMLLRR
jgi:hypothetical protein